jgi:hypothetical protein
VERSSTGIVFAIDGVVIVNSSDYDPNSFFGASNRHASGALLNQVEPGPVDDITLWPIPFYLIINSAVRFFFFFTSYFLLLKFNLTRKLWCVFRLAGRGQASQMRGPYPPLFTKLISCGL